MVLFSEALQILDSVCQSISCVTENVAVADTLNCVVAEDQLALLDIPPFNRSAMDGYAILKNDVSPTYKIIETVAAGQVATKMLIPGTAIKIMTGAPVPVGTGKVVPIENVTINQDSITILQDPRTTNIASQGEDIKSGEVILKAGTLIGPLEIANLVSVGITQITVYKKPTIAIISTGDEIVNNFHALQPGKIMDSNGPMLQALCAQHGLEVRIIHKVKDNCQDLIAALCDISQQADIVILSGGVSVGDFDYVAKAIAANGFKIHFDKIAIKPGRPTTFASKNNKLIFGLPGNPVAAFLAFHLFVKRALKVMLQVNVSNDYLHLPLACDFQRKSTDRLEFVPCVLQTDGTLLPLKIHGSAHLAALLKCDGFFIVKQGFAKIDEHSSVEFFYV